MLKNKKIVVFLLAITMIFAALLGTGCSDGDADIRIGGKNFSEQYILPHMLSILIEENTDLTTDVTVGLGTKVLFDAVDNAEIDMMVDYTGTALMAILDMELVNDPDEVYDIVKREYSEQYGLKMLPPLGFNNTNAMIVTEETAQQYGLEKASDLEENADQYILGCSQEFNERPDGYPGFVEHYGFELGGVSPMDSALMYQAVDSGDVDVISGFSTDGRIAAFGLKILEDDKDFHPPYYAATVVREDVLEEYPQLEDLLNQLAGRFDEEIMSDLNARVDLDEEEPEDVARDFLEQEGLI